MCKSVKGAAYFGSTIHVVAAFVFLLWFLFDTVISEVRINLWRCAPIEGDEPKPVNVLVHYLNLPFKFLYYVCLCVTGIYIFRGVERGNPRVIKFALLVFVVVQVISLALFITIQVNYWEDESSSARPEVQQQARYAIPSALIQGEPISPRVSKMVQFDKYDSGENYEDYTLTIQVISHGNEYNKNLIEDALNKHEENYRPNPKFTNVEVTEIASKVAENDRAGGLGEQELYLDTFPSLEATLKDSYEKTDTSFHKKLTTPEENSISLMDGVGGNDHVTFDGEAVVQPMDTILVQSLVESHENLAEISDEESGTIGVKSDSPRKEVEIPPEIVVPLLSTVTGDVDTKKTKFINDEITITAESKEIFENVMTAGMSSEDSLENESFLMKAIQDILLGSDDTAQSKRELSEELSLPEKVEDDNSLVTEQLLDNYNQNIDQSSSIVHSEEISNDFPQSNFTQTSQQTDLNFGDFSHLFYKKDYGATASSENQSNELKSEESYFPSKLVQPDFNGKDTSSDVSNEADNSAEIEKMESSSSEVENSQVEPPLTSIIDATTPKPSEDNNLSAATTDDEEEEASVVLVKVINNVGKERRLSHNQLVSLVFQVFLVGFNAVGSSIYTGILVLHLMTL